MANSPTRVANSVFWSGIERLSVQGIQFVLTIILARMVSPSDYGLIALLTVFLVMAQVFIDSGFSMALIQKQNPTDKDFSTVFYFNIIVGVAIYLFLFFAAKYIALFFKEPHLELIAKVVFLNIIITSFAVVQRAKLTIALNFKLQTVASLFAVISSGILGVYLAYNGYNVWALVLQTLLNNLLNVCCLWILVKWFPSFSFSWESFRQLFTFGSKLLLAGVISSFYGQLYTIVIGREFSTVNLGYYNRASSFANWFSIQFQEEQAHATIFMKYLLSCGGKVTLAPIASVKTEWKSPLEAFEDTLAHERKVTALIHDLCVLADEEKDFGTANMLKWFVDEQIEEEANAQELIDSLKMIKDNGFGLYMLDKELKARVYTTPAPLATSAE